MYPRQQAEYHPSFVRIPTLESKQFSYSDGGVAAPMSMELPVCPVRELDEREESVLEKRTRMTGRNC